MNVALGISHVDDLAATIWVKWIAALGPYRGEVHVVFSKRVDKARRSEIERALSAAWEGRAVFLDMVAPDVKYPGGPNRMFREAMDSACAGGQPALWLEVDAVPTAPGWLDAIHEEYTLCGMPFLGAVMKWYSTPHLNGVAVYPPDWDAQSGGKIREAPDWNPWDTWSRQAVYRKAHPSQTISHAGAEKAASKGFKLVHPDKEFVLMRKMNRALKLLPPEAFHIPPRCILVEGWNPDRTAGSGIEFTRARAHGGASMAVARVEGLRGHLAISKLGMPFHTISEETFARMTA